MRKAERLCLVVASEMIMKAFLKDQIVAPSERYNVTLIVNTKQTDFAGGKAVTIDWALWG